MTTAVKARVWVDLLPDDAAGYLPGKLIQGKVGVIVRAFDDLHSAYLVTSEHGIRVGGSDFAELWFLVRNDDAPSVKPGVTVDLQAGPRLVGKARLENVIEISHPSDER